MIEAEGEPLKKAKKAWSILKSQGEDHGTPNQLFLNRETATGKFMLRQGNGHYIPIYLWFRQKS